jgi:error-prone DNA polymerase
MFLSLEDETGIANGIVTPDMFDANRAVLVGEPFIIVEGTLQHQDGVVSVKVHRVEPCPGGAAVPSHDFR